MATYVCVYCPRVIVTSADDVVVVRRAERDKPAEYAHVGCYASARNNPLDRLQRGRQLMLISKDGTRNGF